jgi:hypothetical protein
MTPLSYVIPRANSKKNYTHTKKTMQRLYNKNCKKCLTNRKMETENRQRIKQQLNLSVSQLH